MPGPIPQEGVIKFRAAHRPGALEERRYGELACKLIALPHQPGQPEDLAPGDQLADQLAMASLVEGPPPVLGTELDDPLLRFGARHRIALILPAGPPASRAAAPNTCHGEVKKALIDSHV